jgi:hypothetical protein
LSKPDFVTERDKRGDTKEICNGEGNPSAAGVREVVYENAIFWRMRLWGGSL